jgi:uncharacterized protein (DUF58 family)
MITPTNRLLLWVALIVLPFSALAALGAEALTISLSVMGGLLLLVLLDAGLSVGRLDGFSAELPKVTRLTKNREGTLTLLIHNERQRAQRVRVGVPFPPEIASQWEDVLVELPAGSNASRIAWPCTSSERGKYALERCYLESSSPLGFWAVRKAMPAPGEIRVYPNLLHERKNLAGLFLNRGGLGMHAQRQIGKGREFEKLREYIPGDGYDEIHWKATAKRGRPITKIFQIERTQEVYVAIDASRLSARLAPSTGQDDSAGGEQRPPMLERFISTALILGQVAERQGDLYGLLTFSDRPHQFLPAKSGKEHFNSCREALYTLQPRIVTPDFDEFFTFVRLRLRRRALLIVLTALDDPALAEAFARNIDVICRQHLVLVNMPTPVGAQPLFTDENVGATDDVYRQLSGHIVWHSLRELGKVLQRRGVTFSLLEHESMCAQLVAQYLSVKQRQAL